MFSLQLALHCSAAFTNEIRKMLKLIMDFQFEEAISLIANWIFKRNSLKNSTELSKLTWNLNYPLRITMKDPEVFQKWKTLLRDLKIQSQNIPPKLVNPDLGYCHRTAQIQHYQRNTILTCTEVTQPNLTHSKPSSTGRKLSRNTEGKRQRSQPLLRKPSISLTPSFSLMLMHG